MADAPPDFRKSDRWITPGVIITFLVITGLLVAVIIASVAYLTARGIDPDPMLRLVPVLIGAVGSVGTFAMALVNRSTTAKVERNTGLLPAAVAEAVNAALPPAPPAPGTTQLPAGYARQEVR